MHAGTAMWPFENSVAVEAEPPETGQDKLAACEAECLFSEAEFNLAVNSLSDYNMENVQSRFAFTNAFDVTYITTMAVSAERKFLERNVRQTLARRNRAWRARSEALVGAGNIR